MFRLVILNELLCVCVYLCIMCQWWEPYEEINTVSHLTDGGFFHRESLCINTCFSAPSVYSVQTQTLYNTLLFTTVQNQQTQWISSAASSGFWQLLFQVTEEKDNHFWLFNVDLIWLNTYNVVVSSIQRNHCDSAWSSDCFWRTRRHYRV